MSKYHMGKKLGGIFFLFLVVLNYPIVLIWFSDGMLWGMPRAFVNIFVLWLLLILILASIIENKPPTPTPPK
ncbi:MAG: hypothetical protein AAFS00_04045 [Bacteroidota bacterium]